MERVVTHNVAELTLAQRQAVELLIGGPLAHEQQVCIMTLTPAAQHDESVRRQAHGDVLRVIDQIRTYQQQMGIQPEESTAAVDETIEYVRKQRSAP